MGEDVAGARVMVVVDDVEVGTTVSRALTADGHHVEVTDRLPAGDGGWDVVILDGIDVLHDLEKAGSLASIIMLTGDNRTHELGPLIQSAARYSRLRRQRASTQALSELVGT